MKELIATYAIEKGISLIKAKHILVREKVLVQYSVKSYSEENEIAIATARKTLNKMVEHGVATVDTNVIIGTGTSKKGARSSTRYIRGNLYTFINK